MLIRLNAVLDKDKSANNKANGGIIRGKKVALSKAQIETVAQTAQVSHKGSTKIGHALSKHAGRNPEVWGKTTGSMKNWNDQGMKHFNDIMDSSGKFEEVTNKGVTFLEKRLKEGRGIRLNMDSTFKSFID